MKSSLSFFLLFVVAIHDILGKSPNSIEVFIETHISPIDDAVTRLIFGAFYIKSGHDRKSVFLGDLVELSDVFFGFIGESLAGERRHEKRLNL